MPAPPHIVFALADDLGWTDVSYHGSRQIPTPHIDRFASEGITLDQYYVQPTCSPTRASLLTGRHVIHHGVQKPLENAHGEDAFGRDLGLDLRFTLLPQFLRRHFGYRTVAIGKWHLGFKNSSYLPLARGFDAFFGWYSGAMDYFAHTVTGFGGAYPALHDGGRPVLDSRGEYSTDLFARRAAQAIADFGAEQRRRRAGSPRALFLYLCFQAVHSADNALLQAPRAALRRHRAIGPRTCARDAATAAAPPERPGCGRVAMRRTVAAMVSRLDAGLGRVRRALEAAGMWARTLFVFSTDNGGAVDGFNGNMGSNWPLRGGKGSYFEGGVRGVGLLSGPALRAAAEGVRLGRAHAGLFHVTDWLPTLLSAAQRASAAAADDDDDDPASDPADAVAPAAATAFPLGAAVRARGEAAWRPADGVDQWASLLSAARGGGGGGGGGAAARQEVLLVTQPWAPPWGPGSPVEQHALRVGRHKLLVHGGCGLDAARSDARCACCAGGGRWSPAAPCIKCGWHEPPGDDWARHRARASGVCAAAPAVAANCTWAAPCVFDLEADPCEHTNLAPQQPWLLGALLGRLALYRAHAARPLYLPAAAGGGPPPAEDERIDPKRHGGTWEPWADRAATRRRRRMRTRTRARKRSTVLGPIIPFASP